MSSSVPEQSASRQHHAPRSVTVLNWPLRDGGVRAWMMLLLLALGAAAAGVAAESGLMGGICFVALAIATWRLWIPVTFEFRSKGVIYHFLGVKKQIPWTRIARYEVRDDAILLFPDHDPSRFAVLRCLYVRWRGKRGAILEVVDFYTKARIAVASTQTYQQLEPHDATAGNSH